jgi:hypothetical protein
MHPALIAIYVSERERRTSRSARPTRKRRYRERI